MKKYVLQIGPSGKGGVSQVIDSLMQSSLCEEFSFKRIVTTADKCHIELYLKAFMQCIRLRNRIAFAHIHMASGGSFIRKSLLISYFNKKKIPVVLHMHGGRFREWYMGNNKFLKNKIVNTISKASVFVVLTEEWTSFSKFMECYNKTEVVPNFTKLPILKEKKTSEYVSVLFLGELGEHKGIYDLLSAISRIKADGINNVHFTLAGNGEIDKCRSIVKEMKIEEMVNLPGWCNQCEKEILLNNADLLVLPSYFESFGLSLIEGMSYAIPVIGTTAGSIPYVVRDGHDGILIDAGDIDALTKTIAWFIKHPDERIKMGKYARAHVEECYSEKVICQKWKYIYSKLSCSKKFV